MEEDEMEEILYRLDERTKRVDDHLTRLERSVKENEKDLRELNQLTDRNSRDINYGKAIIGGLVAAMTAITTRIIGLLNV